VGAILGGLLCAKLIPAYGWPAVFWVGGAVPLLLLPALAWLLPETLGYLALEGRSRKEIERALARIKIDTRFAEAIVPPRRAPGDSTIGLKDLFTGGRLWGTIWLGAAQFLGAMLGYLLINWLPAVLKSDGLPLQTAMMATVVFNASGLLGSLLYGRLADRFGPLVVMAPGFLVGSFFIVGIWFFQHMATPVLVMIALVGLSSLSAELLMGVPASLFYPAALRATGLGWIFTVGRLGAVVGPSVAGIALAADPKAGVLFGLSAVMSLMAGLLLIYVRRWMPARYPSRSAGAGAA
jgi:MFS transporter, AAHS family, 4-hydroxybenzoate transporter